jgi:hypothetical protein
MKASGAIGQKCQACYAFDFTGESVVNAQADLPPDGS